MAVTLKCAACGAEVEFEDLSQTAEATCPGCDVRVRYRRGDKRMAIPVSMTLPEAFRPVDLSLVADKSSALVGRYRKQASEGTEKLNSDLVLAKALETLAHSIGHLEERLDRHEAQADGNPPPAETASKEGVGARNDNGPSNGVKMVAGSAEEVEGGAEGVVQLDPTADGPAGKGPTPAKANPVGARVLVRREAAREAHEYRREKHSQADWDEHAEGAKGATGFAWLMEHFPKTTILVTMVLAATFIVWTILAMDDLFTTTAPKVDTTVKTRVTALSQYYDDDPEAAIAEVMARGFLNATTAESAAAFVFESEAIREQLDRHFRPISQPGAYKLGLKSRALTADEQSVFAYDVMVPGEQTRRLVVLPEGNLPKVYWQFFAEAGDMSWDEFLSQRPTEPVEMLVLAHPGEKYFEPYTPIEWQSYVLHDWGESKRILAFADRGTSEDWRISDALKTQPVSFPRHEAVMARVKMAFMSEVRDEQGNAMLVAEIREVVSTSWLPKRFRSPAPERKKD